MTTARLLIVMLAFASGGCALVPRDGPGRLSTATTVPDLLLAPDAPRRLVCGHRGSFLPSALGYGVNTLASFERAHRAGADIIETDVRTTRDGVPVIAHGKGPEMRSLAEWRCRGREWLTLSAVLDWAEGRAVMLLDMKSHEIDAFTRVVRDAGAVRRTLLQAGGPSEYAAIRRAGTDLYVVVRARKPSDVDMWRKNPDPRIVAIHGDLPWMDAARISRVHDSGKKVLVNVFDVVWHQELFGTRATVIDLFESGVDIVHTNVPSEAAHARNEMERHHRE